ncbi:radical SAM protein, partial [Candidatus Woesearchaeota archaeon CG11_big_fil_rev_8_21_14_0_20_57_5]
AEVGTRFIRKNKAKYWSWRNQIRQEIDLPLLQRMLPVGHVMKDVRLEIYDGNTTFGRQWGTYPLVIGIKGRHELGRVVNVRVTKHMLRSITGEIIA